MIRALLVVLWLMAFKFASSPSSQGADTFLNCAMFEGRRLRTRLSCIWPKRDPSRGGGGLPSVALCP